MTRHTSLHATRLALALAAALAAAPAMAQSMSAGVTGQLLDATGAPVAQAEVSIVHVESGTVSRVVTDANGRYNARGLRVGGPYRIVASKDGASAQLEDAAYLALNQVGTYNGRLGADVNTLATVQVVGSSGGSDLFSTQKMGAGTHVGAEQLESFPSITRTLQDYARLDPRVVHTDKARNEISISGQNPRYNAIRVDGISVSDTFGLESNSMPSPRQPFSMDVIDAVAVDVASYDVTITGGVGGVINAVTKSGTNEFSGSLYGLYRDNDWSGKNDNRLRPTLFDSETTLGFTFGGPIVKDRLFFFANYEEYTGKQLFSGNSGFGPIGSGASRIIPIAQADIDEIIDIARNTWQFDPGSLDLPALDTTSTEKGIKLDWNITDTQRASFRYSRSEQDQAYLEGLWGNNALALNTHHYSKQYSLETFTAQLFSDWNDRFSTEAKVSYRDYWVERVPLANLPSISINLDGSFLKFGTEENTHANLLGTETWNAFFAGNLFLGDHTLKFGFDYERNDIYNLYGRRLNGVYEFTGTGATSADRVRSAIENFRSGVSSFYRLYYPRGGNRDNMASMMELENLGLFVQDTWAFNDNLTLTLGLRYDEPALAQSPYHNPRAQAAFGFDNRSTIDGNGLLQPRLGFNYTFDNARPTQLRGGVGLFQGASPAVWLSNAYTNYGRDAYVDFRYPFGLTDFSADPAAQCGLLPDCPPATAAEGPEQVDFIDPDLGQPAVWKANLGFETELPWAGVVASVEGVWTKVKEAVWYQELNLGAPSRVGQDGRLIYWNAAGLDPSAWNQAGIGMGIDARSNRDRNFTNAVIARPTDLGESQQFTLALSKPFNDSDWNWQVSYTYTDARDVNPLTSSTSTGQLSTLALYQANAPELATSSYEIKNRFSAALTWRKALFGDNHTMVSVFYDGRSGRPYSYTFDNDANGDGYANDLLYIPAARGDVLFGSAAEEDAFWAYLEGDEYLRKHAGQVAQRNGARMPWVNQFDVRISQELPGFGKGKAEIWLDILNVGNLVNRDWGRVEEIGWPWMRGIVEYGGIDQASGKYVYRFNSPDSTYIYDDKGISRWAAQIGFRYRF